MKFFKQTISHRPRFLISRCFRMFSFRMLNKLCLFAQANPSKLTTKIVIGRNYAAPRSRFYKQTGILQNDGMFEVTLDQRKLKTPNGKLFRVPSEFLARAVATEWDSQKDKIYLETMFLTGLCYNAIDNPGNLTKYQLVDEIIKFFPTDTVLFFSSEEDELIELQMKEWNPVIKWACQRYEIDVKPSSDIQGPDISHHSRETIRRHFLSYSQWSLNGLLYAVETLKSIFLTLACAERQISVEKAVSLSRLEEEFQCKYWGRLEWAHDADHHQTVARLAAAMLFIHLSSASQVSQKKKCAEVEEMVMP